MKNYFILFLLFGIVIVGDHMRVLITGASSGIGYEVGKLLANRGHLVYMTCRTEKEVSYLQEKLRVEGISAICFKLDLLSSDIDLVDSLDIDCLFNHVGIGVGGSVLLLDEDALRDVYEVNFFRSFLLLKKVYQHMVEKHIHGKIFVTSSLLSLFPLPFLGVYGSSKAAISHLVKTLTWESRVLGNHISFCLVEPGAYATGFNQLMMDTSFRYEEVSSFTISIYQMQRKLFSLLESKNISYLAQRIVREMEQKKAKKILRVPKIQGLLLKIYFLFFE